MKIHSSLNVALAILFLATSLSQAETTQKLLGEIKEKLTQEFEDKKEDASEADLRMKRVISTQLVQIGSALDDKNYHNAEQAITSILSYTSSNEIIDLCKKLKEEFAKAQKALDAKFIEEADKQIQEISEFVLSAKKAEELDEFINKITRLKEQDRYSRQASPERKIYSSRVDTTLRFLNSWQDYLALMHYGSTKDAISKLNSLANNSGAFQVVPRSEILRRAKAAPVSHFKEIDKDFTTKVQQVVEEAKGLEDLNETLDQLNLLKEQFPRSVVIANRLREFRSIKEAQDHLEAGQYSRALASAHSSRPVNIGVTPQGNAMSQELVFLILPYYLEMKGEFPIEANESPSEYVRRVLDHSKQINDHTLTWRALDTYQKIAFSGGTNRPKWLDNDIRAFEALMKAENQEKSGQIVSAIRTYRIVLNYPGQFSPLERVHKKLAQLEQEYPEEAEKASSPSYNRFDPRSPRSRYFQNGATAPTS